MASSVSGKRIAFVVVSVLALAPIGFAAHARIDHPGHNDWHRQSAVMANGIAGLLRYHPTDGANYSGAIRRAMDPANVQPR